MEQEILQAPVAATILIIMTLVSVIAFYKKKLKALFVLHPYNLSRGKRWHTLFTSSLVHNNWLHLVFNMLIIYVFAFKLEKEFTLQDGWGHLQLGVLYVVSLVLSNAISVGRYRDDFLYNSLGASGGALAIICSFMLLHPFESLLILPLLGPLLNIYTLVILLAACAYSVKWRKKQNIDHYGHLSGGIIGVLITSVYYPGIIESVLDYFTQS